FEEAGVRVRVVGYLGHWIDEYLPGEPGGVEPQYCAVSYYHAVPLEEPSAKHDGIEVAEVAWFAPDELPADVSPPGNGPRIYAAWREAYYAGQLEKPLPDRDEELRTHARRRGLGRGCSPPADRP